LSGNRNYKQPICVLKDDTNLPIIVEMLQR